MKDRAVRMVTQIRRESGQRYDRCGGNKAGDQLGDVARLGAPDGDRFRAAAGDVDLGCSADRGAGAGEPGTTSRDILKAASAFFVREMDPRLPR